MNKRQSRNPNIKAGVTIRVHREADYSPYELVLKPPSGTDGRQGVILINDNDYGTTSEWDALVRVEGFGDCWIDHAFLEVIDVA